MPRGDSNTYIRTATGRQMWPLDPHPDDIVIEDIAHALALQCRWTGHVREPFSVAQHCCLVSDLMPPELRLTGLLHDASEAYLVDLARPVKKAPGLGEIYMQVEARLEKVLAEKFGLVYPYPLKIKEADNSLLLAEKRDLMMGDWVEPHVDSDDGGKGIAKIIPWGWKQTKREFMRRFYQYSGQMGNDFTTGEYAKSIGINRHTALATLEKLASQGIVERVKVHQTRGNVVQPGVPGWRYVASNGNGSDGSSAAKDALSQGGTAGRCRGRGKSDVRGRGRRGGRGHKTS